VSDPHLLVCSLTRQGWKRGWVQLLGTPARVSYFEGENVSGTEYLATYDAWNRLTKLETDEETPTLVAEYEYDGLNRRIRKITSAETRDYYYSDSWQVLEVLEERGDGTPDRQYGEGKGVRNRFSCRRRKRFLTPFPPPTFGKV
jgi:hypothetical protein